jgi:hypothetical protein
MPVEQRYEELLNSFKAEMQQYVKEGFRASDCFPFVFQNVADGAGISIADRAELQRELLDWTRKIM